MKLNEVFFVPRKPGVQHVITHVLAGLGLAIADVHSQTRLGFLGDGTTYAGLTPQEQRQVAGRQMLNIDCVDISKRHVDQVFRKVFGYSVEVDPGTFKGLAVRKSNKNYAHDGEVLELPVDRVDEHSVYNILVDNRVGGESVEDLRVYIVGGVICCTLIKRRPVKVRFSAFTNFAEWACTEEVLSTLEITQISQFCQLLNLEFGELDVLRDRNSGLIYIVDANRCTSGPPLALPLVQAVKCIESICLAFRFFYLADEPDRPVDTQSIYRSLEAMRDKFQLQLPTDNSSSRGTSMSSETNKLFNPGKSVFDLNYKIINYNRNNPTVGFGVYATRQELAGLEREGYLFRERLFNAEQVNILRQAVDLIVAEEMDHPEKEHYPGNGIFIRYLMDKHPLFQVLLDYPPILSIVRAMLGPQVQVMDLVARVTFLDEPRQRLMWHIHNRVVPDPLPPFFAHPHSLDAIIYLDDTDLTNGALCVIPGSHKDIHRVMEHGDFTDKDGQLVVETKAGDCIFSHSNLWHRVVESGRQTPGGKRRVLLLGFMPSWFKKDFPKGVRPEQTLKDHLGASADEQTQELLGSFKWV
ncbi:phytanoyl-CoA dioxygenase family protein [Pseudomonas syringae group genomosp. 3]|uniref:phytanoyl-CoA dioxygenase family protein n=1 Tax=Pseudomonas syringae group genomosp. 3 TaxID=251701 RepID=UPI000EFE3ADA|nr:phytanoyl-CoA dioxygenase family protein [Pseudomonas syringae group genomosp. 3]RMP70115.1 Protein involved in biosynthesis of mitomycin antibiotics/polyketide fumonisin [Pseudomonas syringae pv. berberidis]